MKSELKTTRIELPDGRLVTIEGGNAEDTAKFLANKYLRQGGAVEEEALPVPGRGSESNSGTVASHHVVATPGPAANSAEEPMEMPAMSFSKTDVLAVSSAGGEEQPLDLPTMQF